MTRWRRWPPPRACSPASPADWERNRQPGRPVSPRPPAWPGPDARPGRRAGGGSGAGEPCPRRERRSHRHRRAGAAGSRRSSAAPRERNARPGILPGLLDADLARPLADHPAKGPDGAPEGLRLGNRPGDGVPPCPPACRAGRQNRARLLAAMRSALGFQRGCLHRSSRPIRGQRQRRSNRGDAALASAFRTVCPAMKRDGGLAGDGSRLAG